MAVELAVGYVSLVPSGRGLGRGVVREMRSAGGLAGDAASRSFGSKFTSGLTRVAKRAAQALTIGIGAAGIFGIRTAANFEQTRIAFEGILGDVAKSNDLLAKLRDFAAKTPFEFTGLADSAKSLLAVGFSADDIIPTMTTLGNVAATLGVGEQEIAGVVRALGQMRGKGKASAEELQQISEQIPGFSAIKVIAEDMGITTEDAFKKMAAGAIPADDAIESILRGMEAFPGASGAMDRQSKTLNGVLSTLKDTIAGIAIDFITPYLPGLSAGVQSFSGFLESMATGLKNLIASEGFQQFKETVRGIVEDGLNAVSAWWERNGDDILNFFGVLLTAAVVAFSTIGDWIWVTVLPALAAFGGWFIDNEDLVGGALFTIAAALGVYAVNALLAAAASVVAAAPFVLFAVAVGGLTWATNALIDKFNLLPGALSAGVTAFAVLVRVARTLKGYFDNIVTAIEKIIELAKKLPSIPGVPGGGSPLDLIPGPLGSLFDIGKLFGFLGHGGVVGPGNYVVGDRGVPEVLSIGQGTHGYVHPSVDAFAASSGTSTPGIALHVTQLPGENQIDAGMRALRHHERVRLELASR